LLRQAAVVVAAISKRGSAELAHSVQALGALAGEQDIDIDWQNDRRQRPYNCNNDEELDQREGASPRPARQARGLRKKTKWHRLSWGREKGFVVGTDLHSY
jgi:hypothetical protein